MADQQDYDLHTLQEEAIRRAREMQARAQIPTSAPVYSSAPARARQQEPRTAESVVPPAPQSTPQKNDPPRAPEPRPEDPPFDPPPASAPNPTANLFDALTKDGDRSLILVLMLILMEDKADMSLLFALMYLLL